MMLGPPTERMKPGRLGMQLRAGSGRGQQTVREAEREERWGRTRG